jgi:CPA2 family monovalent cation:H+ antiporter-2
LVLGLTALIAIAVLGITFWRTAMDLHGHARAGAEMIVSVLAQQMAAEQKGPRTSRNAPSLETVTQVLPGLGDPVSVRIEPTSPLDNRTLAEVNLRGLTGATVLAIVRGDQRILMPSAHERLRGGDVLAVVGSHEAVENARAIIVGDATKSDQGPLTE